jgi:hypothetical protein
MKKLTLKRAIKAAGDPKQWEGNCFGIASTLAPLVGGIAVYGHWLGEVSEKGYWKERASQGFQNHGWIVLPNEHGKYGTNDVILDPTRWSFEAKAPYLWQGRNDGTYDEGGNELREAMLGDPNELPERGEIEFSFESDEMYYLVGQLVHDTFAYGPDYPYLDKAAISYLAHRSPKKIGWFFVAEIYEAIIRVGCVSQIPLDNYRMVDRIFGLRRKPR